MSTTPIIALLALAAAVWTAIFVMRGRLVTACLLYLIVLAVFGYNLFTFQAGATFSLDRLMIPLLLGMYLLHRKMGRTMPKPISRIDICLFFLIGVLTASTFYGGFSMPDGDETINPSHRLLTGYLVPLLVYWIARNSPIDRKTLKTIYATLLGFGVYLAFTGVMEATKQWWAVWPKYIADPTLGIHFGRARGPMLQSVCLGLYINAAILALWMLAKNMGRRGVFLVLTFGPLLLAGAFFTYTRSVWLGTVGGLAVILFLTLGRRWRHLVLGSMAAAAILLLMFKIDNILGFERGQDAQTVRRSATSRASFAYVSWLMFQDRPLFGYGFGQFPAAKKTYLADRKTDLVLEAIRPDIHHNIFLSMLIDAGVIGLAAFLLVLLAWWRMSWIIARAKNLPHWVRDQGAIMAALLVVYLMQGFFHETSYMPEANPLLFFILGLTVNLHLSVRAGMLTESLPAATTSQLTSHAMLGPTPDGRPSL